MSSFLGKINLSRGLRNNNPGNLVYTSSAWVGKIPYLSNTDQNKHFEQFTDVKFGIRAMLIDILGDIGKGKDTVKKLISEYAPPNENNTALYVQKVAKAVGLLPEQKIYQVDVLFMMQIARAIINHENGKDGLLITDSDILDAIDILERDNINGIKIDSKKTFRFNVIIVPVLLFLYTVFTVTV